MFQRVSAETVFVLIHVSNSQCRDSVCLNSLNRNMNTPDISRHLICFPGFHLGHHPTDAESGICWIHPEQFPTKTSLIQSRQHIHQGNKCGLLASWIIKYSCTDKDFILNSLLILSSQFYILVIIQYMYLLLEKFIWN